MIYSSWSDIGALVVKGIGAYVFLIVILRLSGKRTLSKLNAFDLVVTVALGSTLATILLDSSVPLAEGAAALGLLVLLQFLISWSSVRSSVFSSLVRSEPVLLLRKGHFLQPAMRRERVTEDEIEAAIRAAGIEGRKQAAAVILETDGTLSVLPAPASEPAPVTNG